MLTRLVHGAAAFVARFVGGGHHDRQGARPRQVLTRPWTIRCSLTPSADRRGSKPPWLMWTGAILAAVLALGSGGCQVHQAVARFLRPGGPVKAACWARHCCWWSAPWPTLKS